MEMWSFDLEEKARLCNIRNLIVLAMADGEIKPSEIEVIAAVAKRDNISIDRVYKILDGTESVETVSPKDKTTKTLYLKDMITLMLSDGEIDIKELACCKAVAESYGINADEVFDIIQKVQEENVQYELTETEQFVVEALSQYDKGNTGDATYHPLYKAWRSYQNKPWQLNRLQNFGRYGKGLLIFLSYGTVSDIDDQQQLASLSYLFLSKAIIKNPANVNHYKNRLVLMIQNHEAFRYTVSEVVDDADNWYAMHINPFKARDAMYKMEYADLSTNKALLTIDMLNSKHTELKSMITSGFFGRNETFETIIETGKELHGKVLAYLEEKVLEEGDIDF